MAKNSNLTAAKKAKNDEFYTQLSDIEKELCHYWDQLRGKIVYCNCDNPEWSNFWKYFDLNFDHIGLRGLIATYYNPGGCGLMAEIGRDPVTGEKMPLVQTELQGNGDFRSEECVEVLKRCDVVVTNPAFSLFREFVAQLMQYDKKFLIIGNMNAVTYKDVFPLLRDNKMWYGPSISSGDREFGVPDNYLLQAAGWRVDADGRKYIRVKGVRWFTNLEHKKRHEPLMLFRRYVDNPERYLKYDSYDAINVDKVQDIPEDYDGVMGVPITFLDKYCPEQFEIIGLDRYVADNPRYGHRFELNGREVYARILIRRK